MSEENGKLALQVELPSKGAPVPDKLDVLKKKTRHYVKHYAELVGVAGVSGWVGFLAGRGTPLPDFGDMAAFAALAVAVGVYLKKGKK